MHTLAPRRIVNKPWGKTDLGILASDEVANLIPSGDRIGEIWFEPGESDVLIKYLFTSERLSIQVHPDDDQAKLMQVQRGKEECWLILEADPGAEYGIGLKREVTEEELRSAALDGSIVDLIDWRIARVGEFIYNPAGTIHALGRGLTVLEVQQNSDTTLRLFDYFSERPLHVDQAIAISRRVPHHHPLDTHIDFVDSRILVDGPKFGLAFCRARLPELPNHRKDFQLVTWADAIHVGDTRVPPGSMVRLERLDDISANDDQQFFVIWGRHPCP